MPIQNTPSPRNYVTCRPKDGCFIRMSAQVGQYRQPSPTKLKVIILFVTFQSLGFFASGQRSNTSRFFFRPKCLTLRGHVIALTTIT